MNFFLILDAKISTKNLTFPLTRFIVWLLEKFNTDLVTAQDQNFEFSIPENLGVGKNEVWALVCPVLKSWGVCLVKISYVNVHKNSQV